MLIKIDINYYIIHYLHNNRYFYNNFLKRSYVNGTMQIEAVFLAYKYFETSLMIFIAKARYLECAL